MYSYTLSLTSALNGVAGQCHALAALPPGKRPVTCTVGWIAQGQSGWVQKNLTPPLGFDS